MPSEHTSTLLDVSARVAERLRTDPRVANYLDPAIYIAAFDEGCDATLLERLELTKIVSEIRCNRDQPDATTVGPTVAVLVVDKHGATFYLLPDPRYYPAEWPWTQSENAEC
jgi:hypothetical protein